MSRPVHSTSLSSAPWEYKQEGSDTSTEWSECVTFPTVIHYELEKAGKIEDPFVGDNEKKIQWVGSKDWSFRTQFSSPTDFSAYKRAYLVFDGLDTIATVTLNREEILKSDNMFIPYRVDVTNTLREGVNDLHILFDSAEKVGREREVKYGKRTTGLRDSSRVYIRKAQYHWGWDWGMLRVLWLMSIGLTIQQAQRNLPAAHIKISVSSCSTTGSMIYMQLQN